MTTTEHLEAEEEWRAHASELRRVALRLTERPTINACEKIAALTHIADELDAEAEEHSATA